MCLVTVLKSCGLHRAGMNTVYCSMEHPRVMLLCGRGLVSTSCGVGMYTLFIVWVQLGALPTSSCWYVHYIHHSVGPKKGHVEL